MSALIFALTGAFGTQAQATDMAPDIFTERPFDIPAGQLSRALNQFAVAAGIQLSVDASVTANLTSSGIKGFYSVSSGFEAVLAGTGLVAVNRGRGEYTLRKVSKQTRMDDSVTVLPAVTAQLITSETTEGSGSYTTGRSSSATGLNLSLRETPQSMTVITRQQMDDQGLTSFGDVLKQTPGVFAAYESGTPIGGPTANYARGYQIDNYMIDGVSTPHEAFSGESSWVGIGSMNSAIYDSIQVVRGATGLMTGTGDPSASINLLRKRPTDQFQASLEQGFGRWNQRRTVADVGGPLNGDGTLRGRLVAGYDAGQSWIDRYRGHKSIFYGVLDADLGDKTLLSLAVEHGEENAHDGGQYAGPSVAFTDGTPTSFSRDINSLADWSVFRSRRTMLSARLEHRFNEDWRTQLSYSHSNFDNFNKAGYAGIYGGPLAIDGTGRVGLYRGHTDNVVDVLDFKVEGKYSLAGRQHDLVAGFSASWSERKIPDRVFVINDTAPRAQLFGWSGSFPEPDWSGYTTAPIWTKTKQSGAYVTTRLHATDDLSFIVGARWSNWRSQDLDLTTGAVEDDRKEYNIVTPYFGVNYNLNRWLTAYASHTEIFNPQSYQDVNGRLLDPEKGHNTELGLKAEWFDGRLNASLAVFQSGKDNVAVQDGNNLSPNGGLAYRAENKTKGRGWELEMSGELADGWQMQAGYTRTVLRDSSGTRLNTATQPKHLFKLFTTWTPSSINGLTVGGGIQWQSKSYTENANPLIQRLYTQNSYAVVNLMANYHINDHLSLALNLNNLFDKSYRTSPHLHSYGAPRNLFATVKYRF